MSISDEELVHRVKGGDRSAFDQIVEEHKEKAFRIALRMVRNEDDAQDLTQEAFVRVFEGVGRFEGKSSFFTWFCRILMNLCIDHQRSKKRWFLWGASVDQPEEFSFIPKALEKVRSGELDPLHRIEKRQLRVQIKKCLKGFPPRQRAVFILRHYQEMPLREIGEVLEMAEGTVKSHLFRSIRTLQSELKEYQPGNR